VVGLAAGGVVGVAGVWCVEDFGDCCQGLVFVGAADVWVGCDFSGLVLVVDLRIVLSDFGDLLLSDGGFLLAFLFLSLSLSQLFLLPSS
jgi:hypothetical protein